MERLPKKDLSAHVVDAMEMRELALSIVEDSCRVACEIEDPLESYAHMLKISWQKDSKEFNKRFIRGYEVLLEQVRLRNRSGESNCLDE